MWKDYDWNPATRNCENGKYLANIVDDSAIICDEVIKSCDEEIKPIPTNFNEKKNITCKPQSFYILLVFLLVTITLLIAVSTYCYMIKYRAKQKQLLPFYDTKLKQFCFGSIKWKWVLKI